MKRTNLVLDEQLLEEVKRASGERTYSGAVTRAIEHYVRRHRAGRILKLAGSGLWEGDLAEMRGDLPATGGPRLKGDLVNRLVALFLVAGLACAMAASAADPTPQALLMDALLCKGDPLETVRKLAASESSRFDQGIAAATFGEEMDEFSVVILKLPLAIGGAKTSAVLMTFAQSEDFGALVYGRFRGDYHKAVAALKLAPTAKKDGVRLGQFTKVPKSQPGEVCPMTIALTPLEDGTFLLGCGWCNG